jgi:hypothetical protein
MKLKWNDALVQACYDVGTHGSETGTKTQGQQNTNISDEVFDDYIF